MRPMRVATRQSPPNSDVKSEVRLPNLPEDLWQKKK